ncbi:MAG: Serine/threonine-protein kinase PknD [Ignavibacteriaceae bacterium]|nr:Serine/threonine-protein kinase PknD [Ignavibacteriaceae bacterium]
MAKTVQNYELIEQIGQGGMGVVYKARHIHFDEIFAVKMLWQQFSSNPAVLKLFHNEAKLLRKLHHPNIVEVSDIILIDNENYIVMEFVEGRTLAEIIQREVGPIRRSRAVHLFKQMLEGMAYIQSQDPPIIHRDLKPLNILVTKDDVVKITDFGIAKVLDIEAAASTLMKGTPIYMSPEALVDPSSVDIRTDVYSLGMTFYEMLCAKTPFTGSKATTPIAVYNQIIKGEIPPPTEFYPGISDELSDYVMKAIHPERESRFESASDMYYALEELEKDGATVYGGDTPLPQTPGVGRRIERPLQREGMGIGATSSGGASQGKERAHYPGANLRFESGSKKEAELPPSIKTKTGMELVSVEGGTFRMGSDEGDSDEKPIHEVTLDSFLIGKYPVTQEQWESVMGKNPSYFKGSKLPVENIRWYDAVEFCNRLSELEGLDPYYIIREREATGFWKSLIDSTEIVIECSGNSNGYRLPTEAEWEYAARGGNRSKNYIYSGSNNIDKVAWYGGNSGGKTYAVGLKQPNEIGIYDMSGNVWEWCWDCKGNYTSPRQTNPKGPSSGIGRVLRGGSCRNYARYCRVANRDYSMPDYRHSYYGFRIARNK